MKYEQDGPGLDDMSLRPSATRRDVVPHLEDPRSGRERDAARFRTAALPRMTAVRELFRQLRLAHQQRRVWLFYMEHNLFDQARESRSLMLQHLRLACRQWRVTLQSPLDDGAFWRQETGGQAPPDLESAGPRLG